MEVNKKLILIKLHFFLFFAALGPVLPFINVIGKQLQVSEMVMGTLNAILVLAVLLVKPGFGFIIDLFHTHRKLLFMVLIGVMCVGFSMLAVIPARCRTVCSDSIPVALHDDSLTVTLTSRRTTESFDLSLPSSLTTDDGLSSASRLSTSSTTESIRSNLGSHINISSSSNVSRSHSPRSILGNTIASNASLPLSLSPSPLNGSSSNSSPSASLSPKDNDSLSSFSSLSNIGRSPRLNESSSGQCHLDCADDDLYTSWTFLAFVICVSLGILGFNIVSSTSDAICFDMLGAGNEVQYGTQRMYGTLGYGFTAMGTGWGIDYFSGDSEIKSYLPAYCLVVFFGLLDLVCCFYIKLPRFVQSKSILKDVSKVMKEPYVKSFLAFAAMAGFCEGFAIYNLFWYMEDLAKATDSLHNIKLLQGITVAGETMFGELVIFYISEGIINRLGYGHCLTFCFFAYFLRLGLISLAPSPWYFLPIELFLQGPTYALSYTCIVAYASAIAPSGTSATMQGVMAGVNDGFGFSIASFVGGALYTKIGGKYSFAVFALSALACAIGHAIVYNSASKKIGVSKAQEYQLSAAQSNEDKTALSAEQTKLTAEQTEPCEDDTEGT